MKKLAVLAILLALVGATINEGLSAKEISDLAVFRQIGQRCMAKQLDMTKLRAALEANVNPKFAESNSEIVLNYNAKEYDRLTAAGVDSRIAREKATEYLWADQTQFCATYRAILLNIHEKNAGIQYQ